MFEVFGDFDPTEYAEEVKERWGDTDAYRESQRGLRLTTAPPTRRGHANHQIRNSAGSACKKGDRGDGGDVEINDLHHLQHPHISLLGQRHGRVLLREFPPCLPQSSTLATGARLAPDRSCSW